MILLLLKYLFIIGKISIDEKNTVGLGGASDFGQIVFN